MTTALDLVPGRDGGGRENPRVTELVTLLRPPGDTAR